MKRLALALVMTCVVAQTAMGQNQSTTVNTSRSNIKNNLKIVPGPNGKFTCTANGKMCTLTQVNELAAAASVQSTSKSKSNVKAIGLTLAKDNSTLLCDGKPCTTAHLADLNAAASAVNTAAMKKK